MLVSQTGRWSRRNAVLTICVLWVGAAVLAALLLAFVGELTISFGAVLLLLALVGGTASSCLQLLSSVLAGISRIDEQSGYLWALAGLRPVAPVLLPALGGGAVSPQRGYQIVLEARELRAETIVELGPGASTALLKLWALSERRSVIMYGVEHDEGWASRLEDTLEVLGGEGFRLVRADLQPLRLDNWTGDWFDLAKLLPEMPKTIDLLVVDGPPNYRGGNSRYPAYPILRDRLRNGSRIYVDDASRPGERKMVESWVASGGVRVLREGTDFCVLEVL